MSSIYGIRMESYVQLFRTSFLLLYVIISTSTPVQCNANQLVPHATENIQNSLLSMSSTNQVLDRRRRESLPQQEVSWDENTELGRVIFKVPASDSADRFAHGEPVNPRFSVDERTGNIVLLEALDFESSPQEIVNVEITSTNNQDKRDTVQVIIDVNDVDEPPVWQMQAFPYVGVVPTDAPSGASIYQLRAKDPDGNQQNQVRYYLRSGGDGMFIVDKETGWIMTRLESGLSYEDQKEYILSVYAQDITGADETSSIRNAAVHIFGGSHPPQFVQEEYHTTVRENNGRQQYIVNQKENTVGQASLHIFGGRHPPQFVQEEYHATVRENNGRQQVIKVTAFSFRRNQGVEYQLITPSSLPGHSITHDGVITLEDEIDREKIENYVLEVQAIEPVTGGLTNTVKIFVEVEDVNDCTPDFGRRTFIFRDVQEGLAPDTRIGSVSATDCDEGDMGMITYMASGEDAALFRLAEDGTIYTKELLDYEARSDPTYTFSIEATDSGSPPLKSSAEVVISLSNVNDLGPVFQPEEYVYYVDETAPQDYSIGTVYASDADGDRIQYSIHAGNEGDHFQIDASTGVIFRNTAGSQNLPQANYMLNISAEDDGRCCGSNPGVTPVVHTAYAGVAIIVNDVNDNVPEFLSCGSYDVETVEGVSEGTVVLTVTATDQDRGDNAELIYDLETNENANLPFSIIATTGEIRTSGSLDRETKDSYEISVTATDKGINPLTGICRFTLRVTDRNDNPPKFAFSEYRASLDSNTRSGTEFLVVQAEDADLESNIQYEVWFENGVQSDHFHFSGGTLRTKMSVWDLRGTTQQFIVEAREPDRNGRALANIKITISDESNLPPEWQNTPFDTLFIFENATIGTIIKTVTAISSDVDDNRVTYAIVQGQKPETNKPKIFDMENSENQRDGEVKVFDTLDYETTKEFELTLQAESSGSFTLSNFITLKVVVKDVNDNRPKFTKSVYAPAVPENRQIGTSVITVEAIDRDETPRYREVRYSIKEQTASDDWKYFSIDEVSGLVTTTVEFDRETKDYYLIEVKAKDGEQGHEDQATIQITIVDVNDNEPVFDRDVFNVDVPEDTDVGSVIMTVTAIDEDENKGQSNLRYLITGGNTGGAFRADPVNGQIYVAAPLDYEIATQRTYNLQYSANDGLHVATTRIEISVTNVNDEKPVFNQDLYEVAVVENDQVSRPIIQVSADDGDSGDNIVYSLDGIISLEGKNENIFSINPNTGEISLLQPLDREEKEEWNFLVRATDEGGMEGFAEVMVDVADENDNVPMLAPEYFGSIREDAETGDVVMTIQATDEDDGDLEYIVIPNPDDPMDGSNHFRVDPDTGMITLKAPIDREETPVYHLNIEVTDGQNRAETTAIIEVEDVNDNSPTFLNGPYEVEADETLAVGETVLEVSAIDPDEDFRDDVVFGINGGNGDGLFEIVTDTVNLVGIVKVAKPLDFETQPRVHILTLQVSDGVNPDDDTTATIILVDISDEPPRFDQDQYTATIPEDTDIGDEVITVTATDPESGPAGDFEYDILDESDPDNLFSIDPDTGVITVAKDLDRETEEVHELLLLAKDKGVPPQTGTATLLVTLSDVADSDPYFLPYEAFAKENTPPIQQVVTLTAMDDDIGENQGGPPFMYKLVNKEIEQFFDWKVNGDNTVSISTAATFDREAQDTYGMIFEITERRNGNTGVGTSTVTISITDLNDWKHEATTKEMTVYTYEGLIPESPVGLVGVIDKDIIEDKTYRPKASDDLRWFKIDEDTGEVIIKENTQGGKYQFDVTVSDDGTYPDVVSKVIINVIAVSQEAVQKSGSFRFEDVTAQEFITKPANGNPSKLETLRNILVDILPAKYENIDIFSVIDVPGKERTVDVRYTAHGSPVYEASRMNAAALANIDRLAAELGVTIGQIPVDECIQEDVCESSCTNVIVVDPKPTVINTPTSSLAAISSTVVPRCVCGAKVAEPGPCVPGLTCVNGGKCTNTEGGHTCECESGFDGPDCEQTKRSFTNGFAFFDTLQQCLETHTSLEFITEIPDGTLLYNGPMAEPIKEDDPTDFILIELIDGIPVLMIDLGSGIGRFEIAGSNPLNDGQWHRLDVFRNGQDVEFMIDLCKTGTVSETHSSTTADTSSCKVTGQTPLDNRFLNINTPLQIGGVDRSGDFKYPPGLAFRGGFDGCIKNVEQDGKVYDLATPGRSANTEAGCPRTDGNCFGDNELPICVNGMCVANLNEAYCICDPGFMGEFCDAETPAFDFPEDSYVNYELKTDNNGLGQLDERESNYQIMFRTRVPDGLLWTITNRNGFEFITLELVDGTLRGRWNLGDGEVIAHLNGTRLDDGQWHSVHFERQDNYVVIRVDGGGGVKQYESRDSQFLTLDVDPNSLLVGAFVVRAVDISQDFQGCMNDPRINHNYLGFDGQNDFAIATPSGSISEGCESKACIGDPCPPTYICSDIWRLHLCVCPTGQMDTGIACMDINECDADQGPCLNDGRCYNLIKREPDDPQYRCECFNGYKGENCEVIPPGTIVKPPLTLAWTGYLIIILCFLLILIFLLIFFIYKRNRDHKQALILSIAPEEDIRENYVNYDEEGGGEEDETGYNLPTISIPLVETPSNKSSIRSDTRLIQPEEPLPIHKVPVVVPIPSRSPNDPSVKDFIDDRLWNANNDQNAPPYDTLFFFKYEGTGSQAGSLSSLNSTNPDEDQDYFYLNNWGPQFKKLADIYGDAGGED